MYCPQCLTEYRPGFFECADCRVPLAAGEPPHPPVGDHSPKLVTVLVTRDSMGLMLAKAALEEAGIPYLLDSDDPGYVAAFHQFLGVGGTPLCECFCRIQVAADDENDARALLAPLEQPDTGAGEQVDVQPDQIDAGGR